MIKQPVQSVLIDERDEHKRMDNFLLRILPNVPKSRIYRMIRSGEVRLNKGRCRAYTRLALNDTVRVPPLHITEKTPSEIPFDALSQLQKQVLYEDDELLVLDKPDGIAVHGGSGVKYGLIEVIRQAPEWQNAELAHRLDRDTSGCLLLAKKPSALKNLHEQLRLNTTTKEYLVLLDGLWSKRKTVIDLPLLRIHAANGERFVKVDPLGKPSKTRCQLLEQQSDSSLVKAQLETGRTHQIRVHFKHLGHQVLGDTKYGCKQRNAHFRQLGVNRLFLHAQALTISHPNTQQPISFKAPIPPAMATTLEQLGYTQFTNLDAQ